MINIVTAVKSAAKDVKHYEQGYKIYRTAGIKYVESDDDNFHLFFRKTDGLTFKWGKHTEDDPPYCPYGNEIADIEITKACHGIRNSTDGKRTPCKCCYKNNLATGNHMSFETFKKVFEVLNKPGIMTQIAFGVDAEASEELNPDIWKIFQYTKDNGVVPNVTVADITQETAEKIVSLCGACAVSAYQTNKNCCYDSVKLLVDEAKKQNKQMAVNIHLMVSQETLPFVFEVLDDYRKDPRLQGMNAIVFLSLKQKGRGVAFHKISDEDFKKIVDRCMDEEIRFGMDSCSANKFLKAIEGREDKDILEQYVESCESFGLYSAYINCEGIYYPCSFMEKEGDWKDGIDLLKVEDFYKDVWMSDKVVKGRGQALECIKHNGCTSCPYYDV